MSRTYLNIIDLESGREIRAASFGFYADSPSLDGRSVLLRRYDGAVLRLSLEDGSLSRTDASLPEPGADSPLLLRESESIPSSGDVRYMELVLGDRVLCRFMGNERSIGAHPLSEDVKLAVFCGYPTSSEDWGKNPD